MIRLYSSQFRQFLVLDKLENLKLAPEILWIDLHNPSPEEEHAIEKELKIELPTPEEMKDIEPSSRLYQENDATYMTATLIWKADSDEPETNPVAFILHGNRLITIRYTEPKPFARFTAYAERHPEICTSGAGILTGLLEAVIDRIAEILEKTGSDIDGLLKGVFSRRKGTRPRTGEKLEQVLAEIAFHQSMTSKARDSLVSLGRMISFLTLATPITANAELAERVKSTSRDIISLTDHVSFLSSNITFMLEATLGFVNIEQNAIIKIFSVAAVVFLPPTLVASIYGMNFHIMPELSWAFGYPMAIGLMILSAILPYMWFKKQGWL